MYHRLLFRSYMETRTFVRFVKPKRAEFSKIRGIRGSSFWSAKNLAELKFDLKREEI